MFAEVPTRQTLLIAICVVLTVLALVVPSASFRLMLGGLVLLTAALWVVVMFLSRRQSDVMAPARGEALDRSQSPESFDRSRIGPEKDGVVDSSEVASLEDSGTKERFITWSCN